MKHIILFIISFLLLYTAHSQQPSDIPGLAGWFKADSAFIELDVNGNVAKWLDASGNGLELIQSDETARPSLATSSEINNQLSLIFDGSNDYLDGGDILDISAEGQTVFIVSKSMNDGVVFGKASYSRVSNRYLLMYSNSQLLYVFHDEDLQKLSGNDRSENYEILSVNTNEKNIQIFTNTDFTSSIVPKYSDMDSPYNFLVGAFNNTSGSVPPSGGYLNGNIAEIIVYNRSLDSVESGLVETYLRQKYTLAPVELGADLFSDDFCPKTVRAPSGYTSYLWNDGETTDSIVVHSSGTYYVTATDLFGFSSSDSITLKFPSAQGQNATICLGESINLTTDLGPGYSYEWSNGGNLEAISVDDEGTYVCSITDQQGCDTLAYFNVDVDSLSQNVHLPSDTLICKNNLICVTLNADTYKNYSVLWSDGATGDCLEAKENSTFTVTLTDENGCQYIDSVDVTISGEAPIVDFSVSNLCNNALTSFKDLSISTSPIVEYQWLFSNGETSDFQNPQIHFADKGLYAVELVVTDVNACSNSLTKDVYISEPPAGNIVFENTCINIPFVYDAYFKQTDNPFKNISCFKDGVFISSQFTDSIKIEDFGVYEISLICEDSEGCRDTVSKELTVFESLPVPHEFDITYPYVDADVYADSVVVRWNKSENADFYNLIISGESDMSDTIAMYPKLKQTEISIVLPYDSLYCKAVAYNFCGGFAETDVVRFNRTKILSSVDLWLVADSLSSDDSVVSEWLSSGNIPLAVSQTELAAAPTIKDSLINGHKAVVFNGSQYLSGGDILDLSVDGGAFFVVGVANGGTYFAKSSLSNVNKRYSFMYNPSSVLQMFVGDNQKHVVLGDKTTGNWEMISVTLDDSLKLYENAAVKGQALINANYDMDSEFDFVIGAHNNENGSVPPATLFLNGSIAEILIFQHSLTDQERLQVETYLRHKYFPEKASPVLDLGADVFVEYGFADTLISAQEGFVSYKWSTGSDSSSTVIDTTGYYTLTVTDQYGLETIDGIYVEYPKVAVADQIVCLGDSVPLALPFDPAGYTFQWSDGSVADTVWVKSASNWSVTVTDSLGNSFVSAPFEVNLDEFPAQDLLQASLELCSGNKISPSVGNNEIVWFEWSAGSGDWENEIQDAGIYAIRVTNQNGCLSKDSVTATIKGAAPVMKIEADTVCLGLKTHLTDLSESATSIVFREWTVEGKTIASSSANFAYQFSAYGEHSIRLYVETEDGCGNYIYDTVRVGENPVAGFEQLRGDFACTVEPLLLQNKSQAESDSIIDYRWSVDGQVFSGVSPEIIIGSEGEYEIGLVGETEFSCTDTARQIVQVFPSEQSPCVPFVNAPQNKAVFSHAEVAFEWESICNTHQLLLEVATDSLFSNLLHEFYISAEQSVFSSTFEDNGDYWWRLKTYNSCKDSVWSLPRKFTVYKPQELGGLALWLSADSVTVDENGAVSEWRDLSKNHKNVIQQTANYRPFLVDSAINLLPVVRFDGVDDFMVGKNLYADEKDLSIFIVHKYSGERKNKMQYILNQAGDAGNKYALYTIANKNFQTVFDVYPPNNGAIGAVQYGSGFFRLTSVVTNGGRSSIYTNGALNASNTSEDYSGIETEFVIGNRYSDLVDNWFAGDIAEILIFNRGLTDEERKNVENYLFTKYRKSAVNLGPDITIEKSLCDTVLYAGQGYGSYLWSDGSEADSLKIRWNGNYSVTATDAFGLASDDEVVLSRDFYALKDTSVCIGNQLFLEPSSVLDYNYAWSNGSTKNNISVISTATHSVTLTDSSGCSVEYNPVTITVDRFPLQVAFAADEIDACTGDALFPLGTTNPSYTYLWQDSSDLPYYVASVNESVFVTVTNQNGCRGKDSAQVIIKGSPLNSFYLSDTVCLGSPIRLQALSEPTNEQAHSSWYVEGGMLGNGSNLKYVFDRYGTYAVTLVDTSTHGCVSSFQSTVTVLPSPIADTKTESICANEEILLLDASSQVDTSKIVQWFWSDNATFFSYEQNPLYTPTRLDDGVLKLVVANSLGCKDSISKPMPLVSQTFAPLIPENSYPKENAELADSLVRFYWDESANVYQYKIEWSTSESFTDYAYVDVFSETETKALLRGTGEYFWRMKVFNICNDSAMSEVRKLTIMTDSLKNGLLCWFDASKNTTVDANGNIENWRSCFVDYSLSQANVEYRPKSIEHELNNQSVIRFDGENDYLKASALGMDSSVYSVFVVHRFNTEKTSDLNTLLNQQSTDGSELMLYAPANTNNECKVLTYPPEKEATGKLEYGTTFYSVTTVLADKNMVHMWKNRILNDSAVPTAYESVEGDFLVGAFSENALQHCFAGDLAELIIFNRKLNSSEKDSIESYLFNKFQPQLELGDDIEYSLCKTEIGSKDVFESYLWNDGLEANMIPIADTGLFSLQVVDPFGYEQKDSVAVKRPMLNQFPDTVVCLYEDIWWHSGFDERYTVEWSTNWTGNELQIENAGRYSFAVTDSLGCTFSSKQIRVAVDSFETNIQLVARSQACKGELLYVDDPEELAVSYEWNTGSTMPTETVTESQVYIVVAFDSLGCGAYMQANVTVAGTAPVVNLTDDVVCQNIETVLHADANVAAGDSIESYIWELTGFEKQEGQSVNYQFTSGDKKPLKITAVSKLGCQAVYLDTLNPIENPVPGINFEKGDIQCVNSWVAASTPLIDGGQYKWASLGVALPSNNDYSFTFDEIGEIPVSINVTNRYGCVNSNIDTVELVRDYPSAEMFALVEPLDEEVLMLNESTAFSWRKSTNATSYKIEIARDSLFENIAISKFVFDTSFVFSDEIIGLLYWRVTAYSPCNSDVVADKRSVWLISTDIGVSPELWLIADSLRLLEGNSVDKWVSLYGESPLQEDASKQPKLISNVLAGHSVIRFDGIDDYLNAGDNFDISAEGQTVFIVGRSLVSNGTYIAKSLLGNAKGRYAVYYDKNKLRSFVEADAKYINEMWDLNGNFECIASVCDFEKETMSVYKNGLEQGEISVKNSSDLNTAYDFLIGAFNNSQGTVPPYAGYYLNGDIAEILIYDQALTDDQLFIVNKYLVQKYFPDLLPVDLGDDIVVDGFCPVQLGTKLDYRSYSWSTGETSPEIYVEETGVYYLTVTNSLGIHSSDSVSVVFKGDREQNVVICMGDSVTLNLPSEGQSSYLWLDGGTLPSKTVADAGTYVAIVTDDEFCSGEFYFQVSIDSFATKVNVPSDTMLCQYNMFCPEIDMNGVFTYEWSGGGTDSCMQVLEEGVYELTVTNENMCVAEKKVLVAIKGNAPNVDFSVDRLCDGIQSNFESKVVSDAGIKAYMWDFGNDSVSFAQNPTVAYVNPNNYAVSLTVEDNNGCLATVKRKIAVTSSPEFELMAEDACVGLPNSFGLHLSETDSVYSIYWDFGDGNMMEGWLDSYQYASAGDYQVSLTLEDSLGCYSDKVKKVTVFDSLLAPEIPSLLMPVKNDVVLEDSVVFEWSGDAYRWSLFIYADSLRQKEVARYSKLKYNHKRILLPYIDTLYWQVKALNLCGDSAMSDVVRFVRFSPLTVSPPSMWLIADSIQSTDSTQVSLWASLSGDFSLSTIEASEPILLHDQINGHSVVRFDGIDDYLDGGDILDISDKGQTVFFVASNENLSGTYYAKSSLSNIFSRHSLHKNSNLLNYLFHDNSKKLIKFPDTDTSMRILSVSVDPAKKEAVVIIDGIQAGIVNFESIVDMNNSFNFLLGAYNNNKGTVPSLNGYYLHGNVAEVVFYSRYLTGSERSKVEQYLRYKYFPEEVIDPVRLGDDIIVEYGFCPVVINAGDQFSTYKWNTGAISSSIEITQSGNYSVSVTDKYGNVSTDEIHVSYPVGSEYAAVVCAGDSVLLSPSLTRNYTYSWSNGATADKIYAHYEGVYSVEITDTLSKCPFSVDYNVAVDSFALNVQLQDSISACKWSTVCLDYDKKLYPKIHNFWNDTVSSICLKLEQAGWQHLRSENRNGCVYKDSIYTVISGEAPNVDFAIGSLCENANTFLQNITKSNSEIENNQWYVDAVLVAETEDLEYVFGNAGDYEISLKVTEIGGCEGEYVKGVTVQPSGAFDLVLQDECLGNQSVFSIAVDSIIADSVFYAVNDIDIAVDNKFVFTESGTHSVSAKIYDNRGCVFVDTDSLVIYDQFPHPKDFNLLLPLQSQVLKDEQVVFAWEASENASYYRLELFATTQSGSLPLMIIDSIFDTEIKFKIPFKQKLFWSVKAINVCQNEFVSDYRNFTLFNPDVLDGIEAWFIADSADVVNDSLVQFWQNLINKDMSVRSPSLNASPVISRDKLNNHAVLKFDGINDYFDGGDVFDMSDEGKTLLIVGQVKEPYCAIIAKSMNGGSSGRYYMTVNGNSILNIVLHDDQANIVVSDENYVSNDFGLTTFDADRELGSLQLYYNRLIQGKGEIATSGDLNTAFNFLIGAYNNENGTVPPNSDLYLNGGIAEIIMYNRPLNDNERALVEEYLMKKYFPDQVHDDIVMDDQLVVPYGYCETTLTPEYADWQVSYQWSNGSEEISTVVDEPGVYAITITDNVGIEYVDSISVRYESFPNTIEGKELCFGEILEWETGLNNNYSFLWSDGSSQNKLSIFRPGNYWLKITDTLGCEYRSDSILVAVDSLPLIDLLGDSRSACLNERLRAEVPNAVSYKWSNGETGSETFVTSEGDYTLTVTDDQSCIATDSVRFTINGTAPILVPMVANTCLGDTSIISLSVSNELSLDSSLWHVGDSLIQQEQLSFVFNEGLNYVPVRAWANDGCSDSITVEININPLPVAHFMPRVACERQTTRFYDRSEPTQGRLEANTWLVNGQTFENLSSVEELFENAGRFHVSISVTDSYGCTDSTSDSVEVRPAPVPDFVHTPICDEQTSFFFNRIETQTYNQILDYQWIINEVEIHQSDIYYYISELDSIAVSLTAKAINGCTSTANKLLPVGKQPRAKFGGEEVCLHDSIQFTDSSTVQKDRITGWSWLLNQEDSLYGQNPKHLFADTGRYRISLQVITDKGCIDTASKEVIVHPLPKAEFSFYPKFGGAPLPVTFINESEAATRFEWDVNGETMLYDEQPSYIFTNTGNFYVKLQSENKFGCTDTASHFINTYISNYNIVIQHLAVEEYQGHYRISVEFQNLSPDAVYMLNFILQDPQVGLIKEIWEGELLPGAKGRYTFESLIFMQNNLLPEYICLELQVADDQNVYFNTDECISTSEELSLYDIFPNPVEDEAKISFGLPSEGTYIIEITEATGRILFSIKGDGLAGYNENTIITSPLAPAVYFIRLIFNDDIKTTSFIKGGTNKK